MMNNKRRKKTEERDFFIPIMCVLGLVILCVWINLNSGSYISTKNAFIEGKLFAVNSRVSASVIHVNVEENQEVKKGDVLLELDTSDYEYRMHVMEDRIKAAKNELNKQELIKDDEQLQSQEDKPVDINASLSRYGFSQNDFGKYAPGVLPLPPAKDKSMLISDTEKQKAEANKQQEVTEEKEPKPLTPQEIAKDIQKMEAEIEQLKLEMSYSKVYAPCDGTISVINVSEGSWIDTGQTLLSIVPSQVWIVANLPMEDANNITSGQAAYAKIDAFPRRKFKGVVDSIQRASEMNSNVVLTGNMNENYSKNSLEQQVRVVFVEDYSGYNLAPGTAVTLYIKK